MHTFNSLYPIRWILLVLLSFISFNTIIAGNVINFSSFDLEDGIVKDTIIKNEKVTLTITNGKTHNNTSVETSSCHNGTTLQISENYGEILTSISISDSQII